MVKESGKDSQNHDMGSLDESSGRQHQIEILYEWIFLKYPMLLLIFEDLRSKEFFAILTWLFPVNRLLYPEVSTIS